MRLVANQERAVHSRPRRSMTKKKRGRGRPTKLTDEVASSVLDLLRRGNYLETAAIMSGVDPSTVRGWLKRGREAKSGAYRDFFAAVRRAIVRPEIEDTETIRKAAASDWRAAAWRLEHRYPQRWARKTTKHEVTGKGGSPLQEGPRTVIYLPDNGRLPPDTSGDS